MLDRRFIVENAAAVKQNCANRNVSCDIDRFLALEGQRRALLVQVEELNRQANEVAKTIGKAKDPAEKDAIKEEGRKLREQKDAAQQQHDQLEAEIRAIELTMSSARSCR
jgi:seryl-tRNA synthetase